MITNLVLILVSALLTFPLSHVFIKKGMVMDYFLDKEFEKKIKVFFYIPFINVVISSLYLIWVIVKFKRFE